MKKIFCLVLVMNISTMHTMSEDEIRAMRCALETLEYCKSLKHEHTHFHTEPNNTMTPVHKEICQEAANVVYTLICQEVGNRVYTSIRKTLSQRKDH